MSRLPCFIRVRDHSESKGVARLVLLVIASRARPDGTGSYGSYESVGRGARMSRRSAARYIAALVESGELEVHSKAGPNGVNRFTVHLPDHDNRWHGDHANSRHGDQDNSWHGLDEPHRANSDPSPCQQLADEQEEEEKSSSSSHAPAGEAPASASPTDVDAVLAAFVAVATAKGHTAVPQRKVAEQLVLDLNRPDLVRLLPDWKVYALEGAGRERRLADLVLSLRRFVDNAPAKPREINWDALTAQRIREMHGP